MATEITKAVQWLETSLPALRALAVESEQIADLKGARSRILAEIDGLKTQQAALKADIDTEAQSLAVSKSKREQALEAQTKTALSRLEDLQRQQQAYEARLGELRTKIEEQGKLHALREGEHIALLRNIEGQVAKANGDLAQAQAKIRALHANLEATVR